MHKNHDAKVESLTASQGIFKNLFKPQELEDRQIDRRVEAETTLVWPQSRVELHPISPIDLDLILVIFPHHAELNHSLGDGHHTEGGLVLGVLFKEG